MIRFFDTASVSTGPSSLALATAAPASHEVLWGRPEIVAAIIGVVGTILGVVIAFYLTYRRDDRTERNREEAARRRFAASLRAEMTALRMRYEEVVVKYLNAWKENNDLEIGGSTRVTTHIFAVYDGNTDKLGLLNPDDAEKIVTAYTLAKGHTESLALVAEALKDFGLQLRTFDAMGHASHVSGMRNSIIAYTNKAVPRLKDESGALLKAFAEAMTAVNNYAQPPAAANADSGSSHG